MRGGISNVERATESWPGPALFFAVLLETMGRFGEHADWLLPQASSNKGFEDALDGELLDVFQSYEI